MSIEVSSEVWRHSKQSGSRLLLLLSIADYANAEGWAWPSVKSLCQRTRLGERYVQKMVREIVEDGELEVRVRTSGRGQESNFYRVKITPVNPSSPPAPSADPDEPPATPPVNHSSPNPSKEPSMNRQEGDTPLTPGGGVSSIKSKEDGFAEFWQAYPNKKKKDTALRAWKRKNCSLVREEIMLALAIQKGWASWTKGKPPGQFIPYPASWLNGKSWEDEERSATPAPAATAPKKGF